MLTTWQPSATVDTLKKRALLINNIRSFFQQRHYLEVDTPTLSSYGVTDPYLYSIKAQVNNKYYYLQTSPEHHMKRLLANGIGPIFQLARVFRDDELGRWHNPEFLMLEWYKLNSNHFQLIAEVDEFLQNILQWPPLEKISYREIFIKICDLDPFTASLAEFIDTVNKFDLDNILNKNEKDRNQYLFLLMSHVIEPKLSTGPIVIYDFPPNQAALAQINNGAAERFEVYYKGIELANGFHELGDPQILAQRFNDDLNLRRDHGNELLSPDPYLLAACEQGLPGCSGVALGFDRLLALYLKQDSIAKIMPFDFARA